MFELKVQKLIWLKINQIKYNLFLNLRPMLKDVYFKSVGVSAKTVAQYSQAILEYLKEQTLTNFRQLIDIVVLDVPGKKLRFSCNYLLLSLTQNIRFAVNIKTDEIIPLSTVTNLFESANWLEREVWDLFGIFSEGHSDLRRILTDYGFSGHPLRKDFPLTGFFEIRYNDSRGCIVSQPVELAQELRIFTLENPWINSSVSLKKKTF